jgi:hypothetical protein
MNGCRVGRVLRRLKVGEVIREGDGWFENKNWMQYDDPPALGKIEYFFWQPYRPLTPEEVEEIRTCIERMKVAREHPASYHWSIYYKKKYAELMGFKSPEEVEDYKRRTG